MDIENVEKELLGCVSEILSRENAQDIGPDTLLVELGLDSLGLVEIFVFIEKRYNLRLLDSGITRQDMETISSLARYIAARI